MKKIKFLVLLGSMFILSCLCLNININAAEEEEELDIAASSSSSIPYLEDLEVDQACIITYQTKYVNTPLGTEVEVREASGDYGSIKKAWYKLMYSTYFPNAEFISDASLRYNCHSYAWYQQSTSNSYWMNDPSAYYTDGSYVEVTNPQVGDIICYFDNKSTDTLADDINLHSGVVDEILNTESNNVCGNSNIVNVVSKWGSMPLYRHRGDECPYTSYKNGTADYVKFYRRVHTHSFTYVACDKNYHILTCDCGVTSGTKSMHIVDPNYNSTIGNGRYKPCKYCNYAIDTWNSLSPILSNPNLGDIMNE